MSFGDRGQTMKRYKIIFRDGEYTLTRWITAIDEHFLTKNEKWNNGYAELQVSNYQHESNTHYIFCHIYHYIPLKPLA